MREISTDIEIAATPEAVWAVLTDFNNWKDWNPIINSAEGSNVVGESLTIVMKGKDGADAQKYSPTVTISDVPNHFRFSTKIMAGFMMRNDKIFKLEKTETGTKLTHIEAFSGLMVSLFWGKMSTFVPGMLNSMNDALKAKVES